jgi:sugar phosphate isomerase/epimerase
MQGRWGDGLDRGAALDRLADVLHDLGTFAKGYQTPVIYEPLNRYETNLINRLEDGVALVQKSGSENVKLLADLFHMSIEEADLAAALRAAGPHVGHVHLADSNRRPAGLGHTDFAPIGHALRDIGYAGFVSAEALPYPTPDEAARHTIAAFRRYFA